MPLLFMYIRPCRKQPHFLRALLGWSLQTLQLDGTFAITRFCTGSLGKLLFALFILLEKAGKAIFTKVGQLVLTTGVSFVVLLLKIVQFAACCFKLCSYFTVLLQIFTAGGFSNPVFFSSNLLILLFTVSFLLFSFWHLFLINWCSSHVDILKLKNVLYKNPLVRTILKHNLSSF